MRASILLLEYTVKDIFAWVLFRSKKFGGQVQMVLNSPKFCGLNQNFFLWTLDPNNNKIICPSRHKKYLMNQNYLGHIFYYISFFGQVQKVFFFIPKWFWTYRRPRHDVKSPSFLFTFWLSKVLVNFDSVHIFYIRFTWYPVSSTICIKGRYLNWISD